MKKKLLATLFMVCFIFVFAPKTVHAYSYYWYVNPIDTLYSDIAETVSYPHLDVYKRQELKEICLMDQVYVKAEDGKQSVSKYVEEVAKANNAKIAIKGFVRMETGEGIEQKAEDFAADVAAQMAGK